MAPRESTKEKWRRHDSPSSATDDPSAKDSRLQELLSEMEDHMALDRILEARQVVDQMQQEGLLQGSTSITEKQRGEMKRIVQEAQHIEELLHDLMTNDGWTETRFSKQGIDVYCRKVEGSRLYAVKTRTVFEDCTPQEFVHLCSLFAEMDLMPDWFPNDMIDRVDILAEPSKYRKIFRVGIDFPRFIPIANRDVVAEGTAYQIKRHNAFLIFSKSIDTSPFCDLPELQKGYVRMAMHGAFFVQLLPNNRVGFSQISHDDLKLKFVPSFVVNYFAQGAAPFELTDSLKNSLDNYEGSEWQKRLHTKKEFYKEISDRVHEEVALLDASNGGGGTTNKLTSNVMGVKAHNDTTANSTAEVSSRKKQKTRSVASSSEASEKKKSPSKQRAKGKKKPTKQQKQPRQIPPATKHKAKSLPSNVVFNKKQIPTNSKMDRQLEASLSEIKGHMSLDRILEARKVVDRMEKDGMLKSSSISNAQRDEIRHIVEESDHIEELLRDLLTDHGWTATKFSKKGIDVHSRKVEGTPLYAVKTHTILEDCTPTDFVRLCSLFAELDLMPNWFPLNMMESVDILAEPSKYRKVFRMCLKFPRFLPVSNRDVVAEGAAYHIQQHNAFLIFSKSITSSPFCDLPDKEKGFVRMITHGAFFVQLLPGNRVGFSQIAHDDLKLKYVPSFVINYIAQGAAPFELTASLKRCLGNYEGSEWEKRVATKREYYQEIEDRVHEEVALMKRQERGGSSSKNKVIVSGRVLYSNSMVSSNRQRQKKRQGRAKPKRTTKHSENLPRTITFETKTPIPPPPPEPGMPLWKAIALYVILVACTRWSIDRGIELPWYSYVGFFSLVVAVLTHAVVLHRYQSQGTTVQA